MTPVPHRDRPSGHRVVPLLGEHDLGHYPEFAAFLRETFSLDADPLGAPGLLRVGNRHYELTFVGRSGRPFPSGVEIGALVPGLEPLDDATADGDLWEILRWLVDGVGGDWNREALETTGRIYRIPAAGRDGPRPPDVTAVTRHEGVPMPAVLAFDVNETLLDLRALDPVFAEVLDDAALRPQWFATMLQLAFVGGLTDRYVDFTTAQQAALRMTAARAGREVDERDVHRVVDAMRELPAHPEVPDALARLRSGGFRLVALTNSVLDVARAQLAHAGIAELFDDVFSADEVRALKPAAAPYRMVATRCGVGVADVCLVAAHAWDVAGALAAGCRAAFVARPGMVPSPLGGRPDVVGEDLAAVADGLLSDRLHRR